MMGTLIRRLLARLPHWSWGAALVLLFALFHLGSSEYLQSWESEERDLFSQRLAPGVASLEGYSTPIAPFQNLLAHLEERVFQSPVPSETFHRLSGTLKRRLPGLLEFVFIDGNGKIVPELCDIPVPTTAFRRFLEDYRRFNAGTIDSLKPHASFIKTFFGPLISRNETFHGQLLPGSENDRRAYVYFSCPQPSGAFVAFLNTKTGWEFPLLRARIKALNNRSRRVQSALVDLQAPLDTWTKDLGLPTSAGKDLLSRLRTKSLPWLWEADHLWFSREILPGHLLLVRGIFEPGNRLSQARLIVQLMPFFLAAFLITLLLSGTGQSGLFSSSVRWKLITAFLLASILPLSVMAITALRFLQEKQRIDEHRLRETLARHLQAIDQRYATNLSNIESRTRSFFQGFRVPDTWNTSKVLAAIQSQKKNLLFDAVRLIDDRGKLLSDQHSTFNRLGFSAQSFIMSQLGERILSWIDPHLPPGSPSFNQASDYSEQDVILTHLSRSVFQIRSFGTGLTQVSLGLFPIFDSKQRPRILAQFLWKAGSLQRAFLRNQLHSYGRQNSGIEILAWNRHHPRESYPPSFRHLSRIKPFIERIRSAGFTFSGGLPFMDGSLFLAGILGTNLSDYTLVAVSNDFAISRERSRIRWAFSFVAIIILLLSTFTAFHLSTAFLHPIAELGSGLAAVQQRDFHCRLPIGQADEFARLTRAFNAMMENLHDLEVARHVQEILFPSVALSLGAWEIGGRMFPVKTVGGDYFDYFRLDDGRLLAAIGDVTGHGVSAALGVTMAKTLIQPSVGGVPLEVLLRHLHVVLRKSFREKLEMSICLVRFSPGDRLLECASGGNRTPILIDSHACTDMAIDGSSLGGSDEPRLNTIRRHLEPGQSLILHTGTRGHLVDSLVKNAPRSEDVMERILRIHQDETSFVDATRTADDRTIVLLQPRHD